VLQAIIYGSMLGKVLEELNSATGSGTFRQALLMHGILYTVHRDSNYMATLAAMLVTYSTGHALLEFGGGSWLAAWGAASSSSSSSRPGTGKPFSAMSITVAGEYFVMSFLICCMLQHLYARFLPLKEQPCKGAAASMSRAWSGQSAPRSARGSVANEDPGAAKGATAACKPLSRTYTTKLAVVKLCNALFMALYAWHHWSKDAAAGAGNNLTAASNSSSSGALHWVNRHVGAAAVSFLCALGLACHALVTAWSPTWLHAHITLTNGLSMYLCLAARMGLLGHQVLQSMQQQGRRLADLQPETCFHMFAVLTGSLAVHEDPLPWFAGQLLGLALLCRQGQLVLLRCSQGMPLDSLWSVASIPAVWELPEYLVLAGMAIAAYKWICVGRYATRVVTPADVAPPTRGRGTISMGGAALQEAMGPGAAAAAATAVAELAAARRSQPGFVGQLAALRKDANQVRCACREAGACCVLCLLCAVPAVCAACIRHCVEQLQQHQHHHHHVSWRKRVHTGVLHSEFRCNTEQAYRHTCTLIEHQAAFANTQSHTQAPST
jgi:hypothetical protein